MIKRWILGGALSAQALAIAAASHHLTALHFEAKLAQAEAATSEIKERQAQALAKAVQDASHEFERKIAEQRKVTQDAQRRADASAAAAVRADRAADDLRRVLFDLAGRAGGGGADTALALDCASARASVRVLSDLLGRADERAGILARHSDASRIAGLACEQSYDALKPDSPRINHAHGK